jgi:hypothetical protein
MALPEGRTIDEIFADWHERFVPPAGWMRLPEAIAQYESAGIAKPLPEILEVHGVGVHGFHMHGPGGPLPPWFLTDPQWAVDVERGTARDTKHPESLQYAVAVTISREDLGRALEAELAGERQRPATPPKQERAQPRPSPRGSRLVRPNESKPRPSLATCPVCEAITTASDPGAEGWLLMGEVNGAPVYLCAPCREYVKEH